jgi:uncharacterized YccA/Bax inhibitor family protein
MKITALERREDLSDQPKLNEIYNQFDGLINELNAKALSNDTILFINKVVEEINAISRSGRSLKRLLLKKQSGIIKLTEKKHRIVVKNYYRNQWLVLGTAVFGIPIGLAMAAGGNMGSLALGLPIGLAIGIAIGSEKDKKAFKEGRQLNIDLKDIFCF